LFSCRENAEVISPHITALGWPGQVGSVAMEYVNCFEGGPVDGLRERRLTNRYPSLTIRSQVESGIKRMAIYEAQPNQPIDRVVYKYLETVSLDEGRERLDKTEWFE
jgi:hypothetical protein